MLDSTNITTYTRFPDTSSTIATQYCDGLRGPLVVYEPQDPHADLYDVDDESSVITLTEWYHVYAPVAGLEPEPVATLINGAGRYACGPNIPLSVVTVTAGQRYRLCLLNMGCAPFYTFSIDGHDMTIIEADGENTQPLTVDSLEIYAGQRYSFVLNANQPVDNYWIRANPNLGTTGFPNGLNSAILRYAESDSTTSEVTPTTPFEQWNLKALHSNQVPGDSTPGGVDVALSLKIDFNFDIMHFTNIG